MAEYIDREALITKFKKMELGEHGLVERLFADGVYAVIAAFPSADVAPVVHGRWIKDNDSFQINDYCCYFDHTCSECGKIISDRYELPNYCPNCGAKMDEQED